jgi:hypothetical protein
MLRLSLVLGGLGLAELLPLDTAINLTSSGDLFRRHATRPLDAVVPYPVVRLARESPIADRGM